jgi:hypothetical protein
VPAGIAAAVLCATLAVTVIATLAGRPPNRADRPSDTGALPVAGPTRPTREPVQTESALSQSSGTLGTASSSASRLTGVGGPSPSTQASASTPGGGPIRTSGAVGPNSSASWSELDVHATFGEPVTALRLTVKVSASPRLSSTGVWADYDITAFDVTTVGDSGGLIYTFQLKAGRTLMPGKLVCAVQFNHDQSHDPAKDSYLMIVTAIGDQGSATHSSQGAF